MAKTSISKELIENISTNLQRLESDEKISPIGFEELLGRIIEPLLENEGFVLKHTGGPGDQGIDFHAVRLADDGESEAERLGIQAKYIRKPSRRVSSTTVRELIGAGLLNGYRRVLLISNADFSSYSRENISQNLPLTVELLGISDLKEWTRRLSGDKSNIEDEVRVILRDVSQAFIRLIAKDVTALDHLEWRDVERVVAEVFSGLGFDVQLTPGSKDGGKDVILTCAVRGIQAQYYVEIKHWRSATRVGAAAVEQLLKVIVREQASGGLFLSTYGYTGNAFEQLTAFDREKLRFGDRDKIVTLCKSWVKARAGIWSPPEYLSQVILDD